MRRIVLLSGIPGAGKSFYLAERFGAAPVYRGGSVVGHLPGGVLVASADALMLDQDGVYRHDPSKLGEAHNACVRALFFAINVALLTHSADASAAVEAFVIDNTNTTALELAPYVALAAAFAIPCELVTLECDPEVAAARNTHGAPREAVLAMHAALQARVLPAYWDFACVSFVGQLDT